MKKKETSSPQYMRGRGFTKTEGSNKDYVPTDGLFLHK
jgi:hypothetical protein